VVFVAGIYGVIKFAGRRNGRVIEILMSGKIAGKRVKNVN